MNQKKENVGLCRDGSGKSNPLDWVMNDAVDMDKEPLSPSALQNDFLKHLLVFKSGISVLALTDIKACFRCPKINPEVYGNCGDWMFF